VTTPCCSARGRKACWLSSRPGHRWPTAAIWWRSTCPGSGIPSAQKRCSLPGQWANSSSGPPTPSDWSTRTSSHPISARRPRCSPRPGTQGGGAAAVPLQLGGLLRDWVQAPGLKELCGADPRLIVTGALAGIERYALPDWVREDYLSSYQGNRFAESVRYARSYPAELPVLAGLLPQIQTPVEIIAGARDAWVPPANAEFLHQRLPHSTLDIVDTGHFTWEDAAGEYAALVASRWAGTGS
jgi:pimeloyl-ACP methyl ester carboxylesterase